nr:hypothetical protein [Tanacetum cinerariifolium]GEW09124.1 hypothetical protein [Tanacetum cinerariifolium]
MRRSSTKELFTPFKEPKQEFQSSRKLFKTLSLEESRSHEFNLFPDLEEYSKEEITITMAETMEHGSDHEDANEHTEKVLEIVYLFHIPNITQDQVMLRTFPMSLTRAASLETKFLSKYCPPARNIKKMEEINNFQQEPDKTLYQAWEQFKELLMRTRSTETSDRFPSIQAQLNNLGREIKKVKEKVYAAQVGGEKIIFKRVKSASSLIKRVYMLSLKERMELDLEARLMGEALVLNRSLDSLYGDYIELNDLNVPLELKRNQLDDLMPTIKEGEVIDEPMIDIIKTRNNESFDEYPSFCDFDRKTHIYSAYNLRFSCMIVVEYMDGYQDQDMGDIILREPFCKALCVEARMFDGLITIHNDSDNMTYQMARSHPRFKNLSMPNVTRSSRS